MNKVAGGEYQKRGDYHKQLSENWSYYPLYLSKKSFVIGYLSAVPKDSTILDIGCGEGVIVGELKDLGFGRVAGLDSNYSSDHVMQGDILSMPFEDRHFDVVLLLDVIEHIPIELQAQALREVSRIVKDNGILIASIPNLGHLASRVRFLLKGNFVRTASVEKHPGDRPIQEFLEMLRKSGFEIGRRRGFFPTIPVLYKLIQNNPSRFMWLYNLTNLLLPCPNLCFLNIIVCRKQLQAR